MQQRDKVLGVWDLSQHGVQMIWCLLHMFINISRTKLNFYQKQPIVLVYETSLFSLSIETSHHQNIVAALPIPPLDEDKIKGE